MFKKIKKKLIIFFVFLIGIAIPASIVGSLVSKISKTSFYNQALTAGSVSNKNAFGITNPLSENQNNEKVDSDQTISPPSSTDTNKKTEINDQLFSMKNFVENLLLNPEVIKSSVNVFNKFLLNEWWDNKSKDEISFPGNNETLSTLKNNWNEEIQKSWNKKIFNYQKEDKVFQLQTEIFDNNGGNEFVFRKNQLQNNYYTKFKDWLTGFNEKDFTLNKEVEIDNTSKDFKTNDNFLITSKVKKTDLDNVSNWDKIGFFPDLINNSKSNNFWVYEKYKFLNKSYNKWFKETLPINVVMVLWKYHENSNSSQEEAFLNSIYNKKVLGSSFPTKASYSFPFFGMTKNSPKTNAAIKFENFLSNLDKFNKNDSTQQTSTNTSTSKGTITVPKSFSDDFGTTIFVTAQDMYQNLFPQFAAGVNHKLLQLISGSDLNEKDDVIKPINEIEKSALTNSSNPLDLISLFLEKDTNSDATNSPSVTKPKIAFAKNIFNPESSYKDYKTTINYRDVKNTPWMFLKHSVGVHAIAIDGYDYIKGTDKLNTKNTEEYLGRAKKFLNFRIVESNNFSDSKTALKNDIFNPLAKFKDYISNNFDSLLFDYFKESINLNNQNPNTESQISTSIKNKNLFADLTNIKYENFLGEFEKNGTWKSLPKAGEQQYDKSKIIDWITNANEWAKAQPHLNTLQILRTNYLRSYKDIKNKFVKDETGTLHSDISNGLLSPSSFENAVDFTKTHSSKNDGSFAALEPLYTSDKFTSFSDLYKPSTPKSDTKKTNNDTNILKNNKKLFENYKEKAKLFLNSITWNNQEYKFDAHASSSLYSNVMFINELMNVFYKNQNNIAGYFWTQALYKNMLNDIFDEKTNLIKTELPKIYKELDSSNNQKLSEALKQILYTNDYWTDNQINTISNGGFKYYNDADSGNTQRNSDTTQTSKTADTATNVKKELIDKSNLIFEEHFYNQSNLGNNINDLRNVNYLTTLATINWLMKNDLQQLRQLIYNQLQNNSDSFFHWEVKVPLSSVSSINSDETAKKQFGKLKDDDVEWLENPFIIPRLEAKENRNIKTPKQKNKFLITKTSSTYTNKNAILDQDFLGFTGLEFQGSPSGWSQGLNYDQKDSIFNDWGSYISSNKKGLLFKYGTRKDYINFIQNLSSTNSIEKIAKDLQKAIPSLNTSAVTSSVIGIKKNDGSTVRRQLIYFEKRNALIALINNNKLPESLNEVSEEEWKKIFFTDPNKDFARIPITVENQKEKTSSDNGDYKENIAKSHFERYVGYLTSNNNSTSSSSKYAFKIDNNSAKLRYVIQMNFEDVKTTDKFKTFIKKYLGNETFTAWVVNVSQESIFRQLMDRELQEKTKSIKLYDKNWLLGVPSKYYSSDD